MNATISKKLMDTALGREKADLVIKNATLLNVYTSELQKNTWIAARDKWIAYVGKKDRDLIGSETEVIDASGKVVIPGLIDAHTHLAWMFSPDRFLEQAINSGTTTIVTETLEPYPVMGFKGVEAFLNALADQPVKIYATAPVMISISRRARGISRDTIRAFLARKDIIGLGESYWQSVLDDPNRILPLFEEALRAGKRLEGHSAGAKGKKLMAYAAIGVSSCHEPITAEEVLERLRLGLYVMIREGSIRRDLKVISAIRYNSIDYRRLILVTDGVMPGDLIENGYMEYVVQKAIDCGFDPICAIQMATLNPAEHFGLDHAIGGIAPGKFADMLILPDESTICPEIVISNGRIISKNHQRIAQPKTCRWPDICFKSIHLDQPAAPEDFDIQIPPEIADDNAASVTVRLIEQITDLVTREIHVDMPINDGKLDIDTHQDIIRVAAIDRTHVHGKRFVGLIKGFRMTSGAIASSAAWDTSDIIVVGCSTSDMAMCVNRIDELQGGAVICEGGKILAELPLPIMGLMSDASVEDLALGIEKIKTAAVGLGIPFRDPLLTLVTLTGAAIPFLRICEQGLVNLKDGVTRQLFVSA